MPPDRLPNAVQAATEPTDVLPLFAVAHAPDGPVDLTVLEGGAWLVVLPSCHGGWRVTNALPHRPRPRGARAGVLNDLSARTQQAFVRAVQPGGRFSAEGAEGAAHPLFVAQLQLVRELVRP